MRLKQFYNKQVKIVSGNGSIFFGKVNEYFYPEDNESGKESIVVDTTNEKPVEFYESDIATIEVVE